MVVRPGDLFPSPVRRVRCRKQAREKCSSDSVWQSKRQTKQVTGTARDTQKQATSVHLCSCQNFLSQPFQLQSRVNLLRKRSRLVAVMSSSAPHTSTGEKVGQALTRELWAQGLTEHEACGLSNMLPGYEICKILRLEMFFMSSVHL